MHCFSFLYNESYFTFWFTSALIHVETNCALYSSGKTKSLPPPYKVDFHTNCYKNQTAGENGIKINDK